MAYVLTGNKSGSVRFIPDTGTITSEQQALTSKVTTYPVEDGSDLNDHIYKSADTITVSGEIVNGESAKDTLIAMRNNRDLVTYIGKMRLDNLAITNLTITDGSQNKHGYSFKATFQKVLFSTSEYVDLGTIPLMSSQDGLKKTSKEGQQTTGTDYFNQSQMTDYYNTYNQKSTPSEGPLTRSTPSYNGFDVPY